MSFFKSGMIFCTIRYIFIYYTYKLTMFKKFRETWLLLLAFRGINSFFFNFLIKINDSFQCFQFELKELKRRQDEDERRRQEEFARHAVDRTDGERSEGGSIKSGSKTLNLNFRELFQLFFSVSSIYL